MKLRKNVKWIAGLIALLILVQVTSGQSVELSTDTPGVVVYPGEKASYTITIQNNMDTDGEFALSAGTQLKYYFEEGGKRINRVFIKSGDSKAITFVVETDITTKPSNYWIGVNVGQFHLPLRLTINAMEEKIEIIPYIQGIELEAGDTATIPLEIINNLNIRANVSLSALLPEKWSYEFKEGDISVYLLGLKEKETRQINFVIETNSESDVGEYPVIVRIGDEELTIYVTITKSHKGERGTLTLEVVDKEGKAISGAKAEIYDREKLVEEGATTANGKVQIKIPQGTYMIQVSKDGYYPEKISDVEVKAGKETDLGIVTLEKMPYYARVVVESPRKSFTIGTGNPVFRFSIENKGLNDDTYRLSISGLPEWFARFKESVGAVEGVSSVYIKSGDTKDVYLELVLPVDVSPGDYEFQLNVQGSQNAYTENLSLSLVGQYSISLRPLAGTYSLATNQGENVEYEVLITNSGKGASITNLNVEIDTPKDWNSMASPSIIPVLRPGESIPVRIKLSPPGDALPGDYKVKVKVTGDQASIEEDFRIIVKEKSYTFVIGGIVILAVIATMLLMFRKFGRR